MIAQFLNRDYVLAATAATRSQLERVLADREARIVRGPSPLDEISSEELRGLIATLE